MTPINVVFSEDDIDAAISRLADDLSPKLQEGDWHLVAILLGAMPFATAMLRALEKRGLHPVLDALWLSSYGNAQTSSGKIDIKADLARSIEGKNVLILDELYDSGQTLRFAKAHCLSKGAATVLTCTLLVKPAPSYDPLDMFGLSAPGKFLVGFGLDYAGRYRGLPYIGELKENP